MFADAQRAVGVSLAPRGIADDRVRGERAPLAGREHERPFGIDHRRRTLAQLLNLTQQLGNVQLDATVAQATTLYRMLVAQGDSELDAIAVLKMLPEVGGGAH